MSVPVSRLIEALIAQSSVLTTSDVDLSAASLAQQLLYASRIDNSMSALTRPAEQRLRELSENGPADARPPVLLTKWSSASAHPPSLLWHLREEVWAMTARDTPDTLYVSVGEGRVLALDLAIPGGIPLELWRGHDRVTSLALLPDDDLLIAGDASGGLYAIRRDGAGPTAEPLPGEHRHELAVNTIVWKAGNRIVTGGDDGKVVLWNLREGTSRLLGTRERSSITCAVSVETGVLTSDDHGEIWSWPLDEDHGNRWVSYSRRTFLAGMVVAPDGSCLYVATPKGIDRWDLHEENPAPTLVGSVPRRLWSIALSPDGAKIVAPDSSGSLLAWDTSEADPLPRAIAEQTRAISALTFMPSGRLFWGGRDGTVSGETAVEGRRLSSTRPQILWQISAAPDGAVVIVGRSDGLYCTALTADGITGLRQLRQGNVTRAVLLDGAAEAVVIIDDRVWLWSMGNEPSAAVLRPKAAKGSQRITAMAAVPGFRAVVVTRADSAVEYWEIKGSGDAPSVDIRVLGRHHGGQGRAVAVAPQGNWLVSANNGRHVRRWRFNGEDQPIGRHPGRVYSIAVTSDGGAVITGDETGRLVAWDSETGDQVKELQAAAPGGRIIRDIAVARDGSWVACLTDRGEISAWPWPATGQGPPAKLYPAIPAWRSAALDDGLLVSDRRSNLTLVEIATTPGKSPAGPGTGVEAARTVIIVDSWSTRSMLRAARARHIDFAALQRWLSPGEPCTAIFACPPLVQLAGLRNVVRAEGWLVHDVPADRSGQLKELTLLIRDHARIRHVVALTEDPSLRDLTLNSDLDVTVVDQLSESVLL